MYTPFSVGKHQGRAAMVDTLVHHQRNRLANGNLSGGVVYCQKGKESMKQNPKRGRSPKVIVLTTTRRASWAASQKKEKG